MSSPIFIFEQLQNISLENLSDCVFKLVNKHDQVFLTRAFASSQLSNTSVLIMSYSEKLNILLHNKWKMSKCKYRWALSSVHLLRRLPVFPEENWCSDNIERGDSASPTQFLLDVSIFEKKNQKEAKCKCDPPVLEICPKKYKRDHETTQSNLYFTSC